MPTPTENTTSSSDATCASPCSTPLAKAGKLATNTAPKNHIQLMPSSERRTTVSCRASTRLRQVSVNGFQLICRPGTVAGEWEVRHGLRCPAAQHRHASRDFSSLSASWPLVAENSMNGRMNSAPITRPAMPSGSQGTCSWSVTSTVKANLNRLSLPAPRNCTQKNGPKRRWRSRAN